MRIRLLVITTAMLCLTAGCGPRVVIKRDYDFSKVKRVAITPFTDTRSAFNSNNVAGDAVADEFILQLMQRNIDVVERFQLSAVIKEFDLAGRGMLDSSTVKKIGRLLGADVILTGTIIQYLPNRRDIIYVDDGSGGKRQEIYLVDAEVGISARMIDVETGVVIWAGHYRYNSFFIESAIRGVVSGLINSLNKHLPQA